MLQAGISNRAAPPHSVEWGMRQRALELALDLFRHGGIRPDDVMKTAENFLVFLKGESNA